MGSKLGEKEQALYDQARSALKTMPMVQRGKLAAHLGWNYGRIKNVLHGEPISPTKDKNSAELLAELHAAIASRPALQTSDAQAITA